METKSEGLDMAIEWEGEREIKRDFASILALNAS